jgi:hypothetical protein
MPSQSFGTEAGTVGPTLKRMHFLYSRYWVIGRRVALIGVAIVVGYQSYGETISGWFREPSPAEELIVTHSEFRADMGGERPFWIIHIQNISSGRTYDQILMEATYLDDEGTVTETDRILITQRVGPGEKKEVASSDARPRGAATRGTLKVLDAEVIP